MKVLLLLASLLLSGCALSGNMPPIGLYHAAPGAPANGALVTPLPGSRRFNHARPFLVERDSTATLTRVSVTTHPGSYFLWVQKPRLTFFFVSSKLEPGVLPEVISLVFRTQSPQYFDTNHLVLWCNGKSTEMPIVPRSLLEYGIFVDAHSLTFDIPLPLYSQFIACHDVNVEVGGIRVLFTLEQLEALRDLGHRAAESKE
jgi:hypothetical protein